MAYELKTFADIVTAVREELKIQSSDIQSVNRIKRNINIVYLNEVLPFERWWWARGSVEIQHQAFLYTGTVAITQGSTTLTLTASSPLSKAGHLFAVDGYSEIYRIQSHVAGSSTMTLAEPYTGTTVTAGSFRIWTDRLPLPTDCRETQEVWHNFYNEPMEGMGLQEFRRKVAASPRSEGRPTCYTTGTNVDVTVATAIAALPLLSTRASNGVIKTLTFASDVSNILTIGQKINVTNSGHYSYNGDVFINSIAMGVITYISKDDYQESAVADATLTVKTIGSERTIDRYRELYIYPSLNRNNTTLHVDYIKDVASLENDNDEPLMPLEDRVVLLYGALQSSWARERMPEEAARNATLYERKLAKMAGKMQDGSDKPTLRPNRDYLANKRMRGSRRGLGASPTTFGGGGSGTTTVGTANTVAIFGTDSYLTSSSAINTTELGYLDNVTSNIQTQLDGKIGVGTLIPRSTVELGTPYRILANNSTGAMSENAALTSTFLVKADINGQLASTSVTESAVGYLTDAEALTTVALADNTASATNVATWTASSYDVIHMMYSIKRGSAIKEAGIITITTDGTNAAISQGAIASIGVTGVTFTVDVSAGALRLRYTTSSTGTAASLQYKLHKWLA